MKSSSDIFSLDIIVSSFQATSQEMFEVLRKTSVSPIIYEVLDMGVALMNTKGELLSSGTGLPSFIGMLPFATKYLIDKFEDNISEGDIFIANSPYHGGITHLNDVIVTKPLFYEGELIAFASVMGHLPDVGGTVPGSLWVKAEDIYQEGLLIPCCKIYQKGVLNKGLFDMITINSRMPMELSYDLESFFACVRVAQNQIQELCSKYGISLIKKAQEQILDLGYKQAIQGLSKLKKGIFFDKISLDDGSVIEASIFVSNDSFDIEILKAPKSQRNPFNVNYQCLYSSAQILFKSLTSPDYSANGGHFRPIHIKFPEESVFNAKFPNACGMSFELRMSYFDLLSKIAIQIAPDTLGAGHFASICATSIYGFDKNKNRSFTVIEPQIGGWGASSTGDGSSALFTYSHGDTFNCPAEIAETRYGIQVNKMSLSDSQEGQGMFRGGKGIHVQYKCKDADLRFSSSFSKSIEKTWSFNGGLNGSNNYIQVIKGKQKTFKSGYFNLENLSKGDIIDINTANGGGYGEPKKRRKESIAYDLKNGYINENTVQNIYQIDIKEVQP